MTTRARIAVTLLTATALCAAVFAVHFALQTARLNVKKAELRAEDIPLSIPELEAKYEYAYDILPLIDEAADMFDSNADNGPDWWVGLMEAYADADSYFITRSSAFEFADVWEPHLAGIEKPLALLSLAAASAPSNTNVPSPGPYGGPDRRKHAIERGLNFLNVRSLVRLSDRNAEGAVADAITIRRLAGMYHNQSDTYYQIKQRTAFLTERILDEVTLSNAQLDALESAWKEGGEADVLRYLWEHRFAHLLNESPTAFILRMRNDPSAPPPMTLPSSPTITDRLELFLYQPRAATYWLHAPDDLIACYDAYASLVRSADDVPETWRPAADNVRERADDMPPAYHRYRYHFANFGYKFREPVDDIARTRLILFAIAIERYRNVHDAFPSCIDDLIPQYLDAAPINPWNNEPFTYEPKGRNGYRIAGPGDPNLRFSNSHPNANPIALEIIR